MTRFRQRFSFNNCVWRLIGLAPSDNTSSVIKPQMYLAFHMDTFYRSGSSRTAMTTTGIGGAPLLTEVLVTKIV